MRRIAVLNQKGGVGKTTTTANLGAALALAGSRVLLIDLDPQGHLSLHFGIELQGDQSSVYDVLTASTPLREVAIPARENATVIPADIDLAGADVELVSVMGREVLLREALEPVQDDYDYLLIDCPPSLGVLTVNALVAANEVLIPLQAHFLALQGLSKLLQTVTVVRQRINPDLTVGGIVLCMHEAATRLAVEVVDDLKRFLDGARDTKAAWSEAKLFETCIRRNIKLAESSSFGQTVFDYAPRSNGAIDYARLAIEMFGEAARIPLQASAVPTTPAVGEVAGSRLGGRDAASESDPRHPNTVKPDASTERPVVPTPTNGAVCKPATPVPARSNVPAAPMAPAPSTAPAVSAAPPTPPPSMPARATVSLPPPVPASPRSANEYDEAVSPPRESKPVEVAAAHPTVSTAT